MTSLLPPRVLPVEVVGDPVLIGDNIWDASLNVYSQLYQEGGVYDAYSIQSGDWFSTMLKGYAWRINRINSITDVGGEIIANCQIEDVDNYNSRVDRLGNGQPVNGTTGYLYQLGPDGIPILTPGVGTDPDPSWLPDPSWAADQISRFRARNLYRQYIRVPQRTSIAGYAFQIGTPIYLDTDGVYKVAEGVNASM